MTHASLFSGIGAAEIAAHCLGWTNLFHCEINDFCRDVLKFHFPNSVSYGDVREVNFAEWQGKVDVLSGGFPCQPFSNAGQRKGVSDDRYLWPWMLKAIESVRPRWVVAENVIGITSMELSMGSACLGEETDLFGDVYEIHEEKRCGVLSSILDSLGEQGYDVQCFVIPALSVGAPHRRKRVFIVGSLSDDNPLCVRCEDWDEVSRRFAMPRDIEPACYGESLERDSSDSHRFGGSSLFEKVQAWKHNGDIRECHGLQQYARRYASSLEGMQIFDNFPSQSPIFGGDDGFPFDVDSLALPLSEWWKESVIAYGNAIVPAVIYEIFRAIDQIEFFAKEGVR